MLEKNIMNEISAVELCDIMKKHKTFAFGAGRILDGTIASFGMCHLEDYIDCIIDNNDSLWGTWRKVGNNSIPVNSPEYLRKNVNADDIIIIMTKAYDQILDQLSMYEELTGVKIYKYPITQFRDECIHDEEYMMLPLTDTILMQGQGDSCENALAIYEYLKENDLLKKYQIAFLCDNPSKYEDEPNVKYLYRNDRHLVCNVEKVWERKYYEYTSKYIFYENKYIYKKRPDQVAVYLKHGTFMLKNVKGIICIPEEVEYAICTSDNYADFAAEQESIAREKLLICGSPRLDFLYKDKNVLKTLGLFNEKKKYILWLPTLRQNGRGRNDVDCISPYGIPIVQTDKDFEELNETLTMLEINLIIKPHPYQDLSVYKVDGYSNINFVSQSELDKNNFSIHSLMRETHALISDYSSVAFDYMLLDRPIAYTVDDMNEYKIGFSVKNPYDYMPGEKLMNVQDMIKFISNVYNQNDIYADHRRRVRDYIHKYQDDKNTERFLQFMKMI